MTTEQRVQETRGARAVVVSAAAALGGFLFGFDTAVINGAVDAIRETFQLSSWATGMTVSCALIGAALGAWFAGTLADHFGRVRVMFMAALVFGASSLGSGVAFSTWDLMLWRLLGGVAVGTASVVAPTYIAEVAPADVRGRLGSLQQLAIVLGIFFALLADALAARIAGSTTGELWLGLAAWRWMFIIGLLPSFAYGALALRLPESPRFLVARGKKSEAAEVLRQVLGTHDVDAKVAEIARTLELEHVPTLRDLRGPRFGLLGIVWTGIGLSLFQQFVGINVIFYYSTTLWRSIGLTEGDALTITVITSITNVLITLVAIALVDKLGRRPLLLIGSIGMTLCLTLMALCFSHGDTSGGTLKIVAPYSTVALFAANGYVIFFGVSWGPVVWVLLSEMFSNKIRAAALAVAAAAQWVANFVVSASFPVLAETTGLSMAYALFAGFAALSFIFVWHTVPETRGKELEEMVDA